MLPVISKLISLLGKSSSLIASKTSPLALRLGLSSGKINAASLAKLARTNKVSAAFIAYEVFGGGSEIVEEMRQADAELLTIIETLGFKPDVVDDSTGVQDIAKFNDEFELIAKAARAVGGMDDLLRIRQALVLPNDVYVLYAQVSSMKNIF